MTTPPRVTFVLVAFNQEELVVPAIEGAFAQDYDNLQIILSDDVSSDRTFEVMQEMAAAYDGPHDVLVRQSARNVGTVDHVIECARLAEGAFMVIAAGDDISFPHRTRVLTELWQQTGAMGLFSACEQIDEHGHVTEPYFLNQPMAAIQALFEDMKAPQRYDGLVRNIPGYCAAYQTSLFADLPLNGRNALNEDALSTFMINLQGGGIEVCPDVLLAYREHSQSASADNKARSIDDFRIAERKLTSFARSRSVFLPYFFELARAVNPAEADILIERLGQQQRVAQTMLDYASSGFAGRVKLLLGSRDRDSIKFILPRIFGITVFALLKSLVTRFGQGRRRSASVAQES